MNQKKDETMIDTKQKDEIIFNLNNQFKNEINRFFLLDDINYLFYFNSQNELILEVSFKRTPELVECFRLDHFNNINENTIKSLQKMFYSFSSIVETFFKRQSKKQILNYSNGLPSYLDSTMKFNFLTEEELKTFRKNIKCIYDLLNRVDPFFHEKRFAMDFESSQDIKYNCEIKIMKDEIVNDFLVNINYLFDIVDELFQPQKLIISEQEKRFLNQVYFICNIKDIENYCEESELLNLY